MQLAHEKGKSLESIGKIHGDSFYKIKFGGYRGKMRALIKDDLNLFKEYAILDSKIVVKHINEMGKRYFMLGKIGVPLTVSAMSKEYILKE
jgi:hypothetical protein